MHSTGKVPVRLASGLLDMAAVDTAAAVDMVVVAVMGAEAGTDVPRTDAAMGVEAAGAEDAASEDVEGVEGAADAATG
jgi:hypothetical protein